MSTSISPIGVPPDVAGASEARRDRPAETARGPAPRDEVEARPSTPRLDESIQEVIVGDRTIEFSYDDSVGRVVVKVRSKESGEVVRQIPPEDFLAFSARFRELLGVLFDEVI